MAISPQRQAIIALATALKPFNTDGGLFCRIQEEARLLTFMGFSGRRPPVIRPLPGEQFRHRAVMACDLGPGKFNPEVAVLGLCPDGQPPAPLPAGLIQGAVLIRLAHPDEMTECQRQTGQPVEAVIGLEPETIIARTVIFRCLPEPDTYLLTV